MPRQHTLTKTKRTTFTSGSPYVPANPGRPYLPARCVQEYVNVTVPVPPTSAFYTPQQFYATFSGGGSTQALSAQPVYDGQGVLLGFMVTYTTNGGFRTVRQLQTVCYPVQTYIPPTPAVPAVPSYTTIELNLGWTGAARSKALLVGEGFISFSADASVVGAAVGLNTDLTEDSAGFSNIGQAWYLTNGVARIMEFGAVVQYVGPYASGDTFTIHRRNGVVSYRKNDVEVLQRTGDPMLPAYMDVSLYSGGDSIHSPVVANSSSSENSLPALAVFGGDLGADFGMAVTLPRMTASGRNAIRIESSMPTMFALASNRVYGESKGVLGKLSVSSEGGFPVPAFAQSNTAIVGFSISATGLTGEIGGADVVMPTMSCRGSDHAYGESTASLPNFIVSASAGLVGEASMLESMLAINWLSMIGGVAVVISEDMEIAAVMSVDRVVDSNMADAMSILDELATSFTYNVIIQEAVRIGAATPVWDGEHVSWVINAKTGASSQYDNYGFNSFAKIGNSYYGCKSDGIYRLDGDTDDGFPIRASVNFGEKDFGTSQHKKVSYAYIGVSSTDKMYLKVTVEGEEFIYQARTNSEALNVHRVDCGRGLTANFYQFEIYNSDGCDFDLATVEFVIVPISRRI